MSENQRVDVTPGLGELITDACHGSTLQVVKMQSSVPGCSNYKIRLPAPNLADITDLGALADLCDLLKRAELTFKLIGHTLLIPYIWEGVAV